MKLLKSTIGMLMLACAGLAQGATISFGLSFNSIGIDFDPDINYATLVISDDLSDPDLVNFVVTPSSLFTPVNNFGVQGIFFNSDPPRVASVSGNAGWSYDRSFTDPFFPGENSGKMPKTEAYGNFNFEYFSNGSGQRKDPLEFSLRVAGGHSALDYAVNNSDGFSFVARIGGFDTNGQSAGWFASDGTPLVPVPASVWLFGTALIGFIGLSRRRII